MSNEPTPDNPDADDTASTPVDPADESSAAARSGGDADPTVDVMSGFTPGGEDEPAAGGDEPTSGYDEPTSHGDEPTTDGGGYAPPQPPPVATVPPVRRLVRDPYSRLGGVCSGIAHHTGVDVSLVRIAFVLATFFSGIGLILYLLAWLIVPRAEYWPPAPYEAGDGGSLLQGRQLAYGLLAIGIVLLIISGAGGFARLLVSVGLIGAGIYLLVQPRAGTDSSAAATVASRPGTGPGPVPPAPPVGGDPTVGAATGDVPADWQPAPGDVGPDTSGDEVANPLSGRTRTAEFTAASAGSGAPTAPVKTVYVPSPVPPRRRRIWPLLVIIGLLLVPLFIVVGAIALIAGGDQDFSGADVTVIPATASEIPGRIDEGAGTVTLDLTNLDIDDFGTDSASVQEVEIDLNAGDITVDLPPDLPVTVDASASAGEISVFDRYEEGIRPRISTDDADAVLELDIRVGLGTISVDD